MTELDTLMPGPPHLRDYRLGPPQQAGELTVLPVFGPAYPGITAPRSGLKLTRVVGYGRVELRNGAESGVAIVPLHMGYIQDQAQNHALCRSAFLAAGQTLRFDDACCVQAAQGGYLAEKDQWFFVLPVELRAQALRLRGQESYSKLWDDIAALNRRYGLPQRGHLEQIISRKRPVLTQFQSRLELLPGQIGAVFLVAGRFAGLEIAPDPGYFAEVWTALVCFAYGVAAWHAEVTADDPVRPFDATGLAGLRAALEHDRAARTERMRAALAEVRTAEVEVSEDDRYLDLRLRTVTGDGLAGQFVDDGDRLVYASLFAPN